MVTDVWWHWRYGERGACRVPAAWRRSGYQLGKRWHPRRWGTCLPRSPAMCAPVACARSGCACCCRSWSPPHFAVRTSLDARRAQVMASTATATVRLVHRLEQEIAEIDALRARGGSAGNQLVAAAREQTDLASARFRTAATAAGNAAPALREVLDAADVELSK